MEPEGSGGRERAFQRRVVPIHRYVDQAFLLRTFIDNRQCEMAKLMTKFFTSLCKRRFGTAPRAPFELYSPTYFFNGSLKWPTCPSFLSAQPNRGCQTSRWSKIQIDTHSGNWLIK